ncbi:MAG: hypothetical protein R2788_14895 [Saprospiraceae bacterium]
MKGSLELTPNYDKSTPLKVISKRHKNYGAVFLCRRAIPFYGGVCLLREGDF